MAQIPLPPLSSGGFTSESQRRLSERLKLIGPGPAAFYRDACRLLSMPMPLETTNHLLGHIWREIESAFLNVVLYASGEYTPPVSEKKDISFNEKRRIALSFLGLAQHDDPARFWLSVSLHKDAHRSALNYRRLDNEQLEYWTHVEKTFDFLLDKFEQNYLAAHSMFDRLIPIDIPTNDDLTFLRQNAPNSRVGLDYFFSRASANWLSLRDFRTAFFKYPPGSIDGPFSHWSESAYLARVASEKPAEVVEVAVGIPSTSNPVIAEHIITAAVSTPIQYSVQLVPVIVNQLRNSTLISPDRCVGLIEYLLDNKNCAEALTILYTAFELSPIETESELDGSVRLAARMDSWSYREALGTVTESMVRQQCTGVIATLAAILERALPAEMCTGMFDKDSVWRWRIDQPNFPDHATDKDQITTALYRASEDFVSSGLADEVFAGLETSEQRIVKRIALRLLVDMEAPSSTTLRKYLLDRALFEDRSVEYFNALGKHFATLVEEDRQTILGYIGQLESGEEGVSSEAALYHQAQALLYIRDQLPKDWNMRFEALQKELGDIRPIDHPSASTSFWQGPTSPLSKEDIGSMGVSDVVEFLCEWTPSDEFMTPSPEGLGRTLAAVVEESPQDYATNAVRFQAVQPTYVRSLVTGFTGAARDDRAFGWSPVLELCAWIVEQTDEDVSRTRRSHYDSDVGWKWSRMAVARLLETGLAKESIPWSLRVLVWRIVLQLLADPVPLPEINRDDSATHRPSLYDMAINSVQGVAFHALIYYALWCKQYSEQSAMDRGEGPERVSEALEALESTLGDNPSPILLSAVGRFAPTLYYLEANWFRKSAAHLFPIDDGKQEVFHAAWDSYLMNGHVYREIYRALQPQYVYAISQMQTRERTNDPLHDPNSRLSEHLMLLYGAGEISLDDEILVDFFDVASDRVRGNAMRYVGQNLAHFEEGTQQRFVDLWKWRTEHIADVPTSHVSELQAFGFWMISESLDVAWKLEQGAFVLDRTPILEPMHLTVEWVAKNVTAEPNLAATCLSELVLHADYWTIERIKSEVRSAILTVAALGSEAAKNAMSAMINRLGARGNFRFSDLMTALDE